MINNYKKCVVVAEIGCNHCGDMNLAKEMISVAAECGVDYVKFQKRYPKVCVPKKIQNKPHENSYNSFGTTYLEHRQKLEFTLDQHKELKKHCQKNNVKYACSVWDIQSAKEIISLKPDYIKIPSAQCVNYKLLDYVFNNFKKDVHISLGMTMHREKLDIINFVNDNNYHKRTVFYWTTSGYPVDFKELFLLEISIIKNHFLMETGFSGHHKGIAADIAAYTLGATWIERHFTTDRTLKGTDQAASLEPAGLKKLCRDLTATHESLQLKKDLTPDELKNKAKLRGT